MPLLAPSISLVTLDQWAAKRRSRRLADAPLRFAFTDVLAIGEQLTELCRTDKRRALRLSSAFLEIARVAGSPADQAVALRCRATALRHLHRLHESRRDFAAAIRQFKALGIPLEAARTAIGAIGCATLLGLPREAIAMGRWARAAFVRAGDRRRAARLDVNLGGLFELLERHQPALARYAAAEAAFTELDAEVDLALTRYNRARVLAAMDRPREARALFEASAAVWEKHATTAALSQCRLELARAQFQSGAFAEALSTLEQAGEAAQALADHALVGTARLERARIEVLVGRDVAAAALLDAAIAAFERMAMRGDQADAMSLRAALHARQGGRGEARADLDRAAALYRAVGRRRRRWWIELQSVRLGLETSPRVDPPAVLRRCIRAFARYGLARLEAEARLALAGFLLDRGRRGAAREVARAGRLQRALRDPWIEVEWLLAEARVHAARAEVRRADATLERAYRAVRRLRCALPLEVHRAFFLADKHDLFERAIEWMLDADDEVGARAPQESAAGSSRVRRALQWSERCHSPRLRDIWRHGHPLGFPSDLEQAAARDVADAREALQAIERRECLGEEHDGSAHVAPERASRRWRERRGAAIGRLERSFQGLELLSARRLGIQDAVEPDLERMHASLAPGEALIEYFVGNRAIHALVLARALALHLRLPVEIAEARESAHRLRRLWDRHRLGPAFRERHADVLLHTTEQLLSDLARRLVLPILERVPGARRLVVVPHRWLHGVPLHACLDAAGVRLDGIRYALSGHGLAHPPALGRAAETLAVGFATPEAPHAEAEAIEVGQCHPGARVLVGEQASREALRSGWSAARWIHVAAHGALRVDDPRLTGLTVHDGTWAVYDLFSTSTRADLVVLSGCQTGEGALWGTDDAVGLLPALFQTGARAAIVSLWSVDDDITRQTMRVLHRSLAAGVPPGDALARSWETIRSRHPSPYAWAPFALYGADQGELP